MISKNNLTRVLDLLDKNYLLDNKCFLNYEHDYELLVAAILSARCRDDRVNLVTRDLFLKYKSLSDFANASQEILEQDIKSIGFYKNKAKHIILSARKLLFEFDSRMPSDINKLILLDGVGRKTANVIRAHVFNISCIIVDTHVMRLSKRLDLTQEINPNKIELDLIKIIPRDHWLRLNTQLITHGRLICKAIKPKCESCFLNKLCSFYLIN
jgi:endonuclease-3